MRGCLKLLFDHHPYKRLTHTAVMSAIPTQTPAMEPRDPMCSKNSSFVGRTSE